MPIPEVKPEYLSLIISGMTADLSLREVRIIIQILTVHKGNGTGGKIIVLKVNSRRRLNLPRME